MAEDKVNTIERLSAEVSIRYPIVAAQFGQPGRNLGEAGEFLARAIISVMIDEMERRDSWLPQG